jgi:diguanylate cyclase (GGDEF)-like protein/PAS domain S-box-containing protein
MSIKKIAFRNFAGRLPEVEERERSKIGPLIPTTEPSGRNIAPLDYPQVFDMLRHLSGFETEEQVARAIFDLFDRICAPTLQGYLPGREDQPVTWITNPVAASLPAGLVEKLAGLHEHYAWTESGTGFVVRLQRDHETLGILLVEGMATPQHKAYCLNLTLSVLPVLTLAVSNARNFEQLERSQEMLRESEESLRTLIEQSPDPHLVIEDHHFIDCNQAALDILRMSFREQLLGSHLADFSPSRQPDGRFSRPSAEALIAQAQAQGSHRFEWVQCRADGEAFPVDVLATAIHYHGRPLLHIVWRDITERKQAEAKLRLAKEELEQLNEHLEHQATHDPLTGVFNRRAILDALSREISLERRQGQGLAIGIGDIDYFKSVNDTHGHPVGDEVLRGFVLLLKSNLRPYDFLGRFGGEEFLVITPGIKENDVRLVYDRLRAAIANNPIPTKSGELSITLSLGVAPVRGNETMEELLAAADSALYRAKSEGRNRVCLAAGQPKRSP